MVKDVSIIRKEGTEQVGEVWTGATFSVAALMLSDGMKEEAYRTAWGVYHVVYEMRGYWFRTTEAYDITGNFRASTYMRSAEIWAMEMTVTHDTARLADQQQPADQKIADPVASIP